MKLKKLHLENFRHCENTVIEFGNKITVISGQNGTGKSSILGWIAQLCDFKEKFKRLNGEYFKEDYSKVFRFCPEKDYPYNYKVKFEYDDGGLVLNEKIIKTRFLEASKTAKSRYRTDFDGRGNAIDFPVIYLGLRRLIPLATEGNIKLETHNLSSKNANYYSALSKDILILNDDKIKAESVKSLNKKILAMKTDNYGHLGNSAGQDNIGQILSALMSYETLKEHQGKDYEGGILLIDEIDATLYAGSQTKLIDNLFKAANNLDLQIIFTTHSLEILEHLKDKLGQDTIVNYLKIDDGKVNNVINPTFEYISNKIKVQIGEKGKVSKTPFICEDKVAEYWIKNLLNGSDLKNLISVEKGPFPFGSMINMAESNHNIFKNVRFVLDGDVKNNLKDKKTPPKTVFLPDNCRPETIMYNFIYSLPDTDAFWDDLNNFTKQVCFADYRNGKDKGVVKRWLEDTRWKPYFGTGYAKLFNRWKKDNEDEVENFQNEIRKII